MAGLPRGKPFTKETAVEAGRKGKRTQAKLSQSFIEYMAGEGAEKAGRILRDMEDKDYIKHYSQLAPYVFPRLSNLQMEGGDLHLHLNVDGELAKIIENM